MAQRDFHVILDDADVAYLRERYGPHAKISTMVRACVQDCRKAEKGEPSDRIVTDKEALDQALDDAFARHWPTRRRDTGEETDE